MNKIIKINKIDKKISSRGGFFLVEELNKYISLDKTLAKILPTNTRESSFDKFIGLYYGFISGAECLDDMNIEATDHLFSTLVKPFNAVTYGRFLKEFDIQDINNLKNSLISNAIRLRRKAFGINKEIVLDIDSSKHRQYGKKMEGVNYSYTNVPCLDSLNIFDEYGFQYWFELRSGETYSANGSSNAINNVTKLIKASIFSKKLKIYIRADSAYANTELYHCSYVNNLSFVSALKSNIFNKYRGKVYNWRRSKKIKFPDLREAEIGSTVYYPDGSPQVLKIVYMRALKADKQCYLHDEDSYDYHAFITNIPEQEMSNEKIILFYRKRGNAENFIREAKNGFDLKHFPCQKLSANNVYGIIAGFAYNALRFLGTLINKNKIPFSKRVRYLMIYLPCQVVKHARSTIIRYETEVYKEVMQLLDKLKNKFSLNCSLTT